MLSNTINLNDRRTLHKPVNNPFIERIIRCCQKKQQLKNWMNIKRKDFKNSRKILILCQIHRPHNVYGPKLSFIGADKADNWDRKTNHSISKLQRNISRRNNIIQKKRNYSPHILQYIPHIRTGGMNQSREIVFLGPNSKTPIQEMPPENGPVHVECSIIRNVMT